MGFRRSKATPLEEGEEHPRGSILNSTLWEMAGTLGYIGLGIVLLVCMLVLALHNAGIRKAIHDAVPEPLARFFAEPIEPGAAAPQAPLLREAGDALRQAVPPSASAASFTVGSTRAAVRKAQGAPDESTDTVWTYGRSKVFFRDGRVTGWSEASETPLRVRRQPL